MNQRNQPIIRQARQDRRSALQALSTPGADPADVARRLANARALEQEARTNVESALAAFAATLPPAERAALAPFIFFALLILTAMGIVALNTFPLILAFVAWIMLSRRAKKEREELAKRAPPPPPRPSPRTSCGCPRRTRRPSARRCAS